MESKSDLKGRSFFSNKKKYLVLLGVLALILGLDQLTKFLIVKNFHLGESLPILSGIFNFTYVQNKGAAFGFLAQAEPAFRVPFFIIVPILALVSIIVVFRKVTDAELKFSLALSLVISGAIGNLIDRLRLGYVIDFLDFHWQGAYHFPAFNIADSAICVGVGLILLDLFLESEHKGAPLNVSSTH